MSHCWNIIAIKFFFFHLSFTYSHKNTFTYLFSITTYFKQRFNISKKKVFVKTDFETFDTSFFFFCGRHAVIREEKNKIPTILHSNQEVLIINFMPTLFSIDHNVYRSLIERNRYVAFQKTIKSTSFRVSRKMPTTSDFKFPV